MPQQFATVPQHHVLGGQFKAFSFCQEIETVLLGHTIKTPSVVLHRGVQAAHLLHPLATPRGRVEERHHPKRPADGTLQALAELGIGNHLGAGTAVVVYPETDAPQLEQFVLVGITDVPVVEIASFILKAGPLGAVVYAKSLRLVPAITLLDFPTCHIGVCHRCRRGYTRS